MKSQAMSPDESGLTERAGTDAKAKRELLARLLRERALTADEPFPLSLGQEDLWFLREMAPESPAYHIPFCVRTESAIDRERLERSLRILLERYPILRCTFAHDREGVKQQIAALPKQCLEWVDASDWSDEELRRRVNESYRRPFDLGRGPVMQMTVFAQPGKGDVLLLSVHHIVFDAWSLGVFLDELALLYDKGTAAQLPEKAAPYTAFVKWQRSMIESPRGKTAWNYWRSRLNNLQAPIDLPADRPRPNALHFRGAAHQFELPVELTSRMREFACSQNVTLFAVLATAFHSLLHRYTVAPEIPIGTPVSGRSLREFERGIGYFVNPVIISAPVDAHATFREHLAGIRDSIIAAQEYGDFPFIEIVRRLRPERDPGRTPLFQVMLNLIKTTQVGVAGHILHAGSSSELRLGSLALKAFPLDQQEAQFDLDLTMLDTGGSIPASLSYNVDLFEGTTVARMASHFVVLLSAAISNPDLRISDLPLLSPQEESKVLVEWNATAKAYPEATLHRLIEKQVEQTPHATALVFEKRTMSYQELNHRANQLANYLRRLGVGPDTLVGVLMERSFGMVVALLGILKAGGAYVPIDGGYPVDRQLYMIRDAGAPVILTQAKFADQLSAAESHVAILDESWRQIDELPRNNLADSAQSGDLAYVIYTSGSTGNPKGAMNTHRGICNRLLWMQDQYQLTGADVVLQKTPFSFDVSVWEFFWPLMTGARIVIARPEGHKDPVYLARLICDEGVTTLHFVPSMLRVFLQVEAAGRCTSLRRVICSGEALSYELQERFFSLMDTELHNLYGPTEAAVDVTYWECQRSSARRIVPIGRPVANTQIYILDANMRPAPIGVPGELYIGGVQVGRGYWKRPDLTAQRFVPDPFCSGSKLYRTGDRARWLPEGTIEYLGRLDHQVKLRGFRIELGEIESVLSEDPQVKEAVVTVHEDVAGEKRLVAYLVCRNQEAPESSELKAQLSGKLPDYMVPSTFICLDTLPLTPNGKLDRRALPSPTKACVAADRYEAPKTQEEEHLAAIWMDVLQIDRVGRNDNFFELGGHSLLASTALMRVRERCGIQLPLRSIFEAPTIEKLANRIETIVWATSASANLPQEGEEREEIEL
jgi:amino acid adenylation domain-containing protein